MSFAHPHAHQVRHCTFVPSLIEMSLKVLSCVANMAQDIDSLDFSCKWLFIKSIDSAVQLSWTTLHAQSVLLLLLSNENRRGSFSHWMSIQITVEVLVLCCRAGRKKNYFYHHGVLPHASPNAEHELSCEETSCMWSYYKLSGIVFTSLSLSHWPHRLPPFLPVSSQLSLEDGLLWHSLIVSFQ